MQRNLSIVCVFLLATLVISARINKSNDPIAISVVHFNDFHARFVETSINSTDCVNKSTCIGGLPRLYYLISQMKSSLVFNAGDNFQGTLWYNLFKWNVTSKFLNLIRQDAMTLGNHEFDDGIEGLIPFIEQSKVPIVIANINSSREPEFQKLFDTKKLVPSIVIKKNGIKIGVIGVIIHSTNELSQTGKLQFLDELESINKEVKNLNDCDVIFIISHCGIEIDKYIATNAPDKVDLIIGGHSHTLLYNGQPPNGISYESYPVVVTNQISNRSVLIVQASSYTKYLGNITLLYDRNTKRLKSWDAINPIYLNKLVSKSRKISKMLTPWRKTVLKVGKKVIAINEIDLSFENCSFAECNIGDFLADAIVNAYINYKDAYWSNLTVAIVNSGGIRTSILKGNVTYSSIAICQPFTNSLDAITIYGKDLRNIFNMTICKSNHSSKKNFLQVSGIQVVYNSTTDNCNQIISIKIKNTTSGTYDAIQDNQAYRVAMPSFLANGGDAFRDFKTKAINRTVGPTDIDEFTKYFKKKNPVHQLIDNRIIFK